MALKKCKECGVEISKKAKLCPHCGAPTGPRQYSLGKLVFLVLFGLIFIGIFLPKSEIQPAKINATVNPVEVNLQGWKIKKSQDQMTSKVSLMASSLETKSNTPMSFPYNQVKSWITIGCNNKNNIAAMIGFSKTPNLNNTSTEDGYSRIRTKVRWDNSLEDLTLTQTWGSAALHIVFDDEFIRKISSSKEARVQLHWHGQGAVTFDYDLSGSSEAIRNIRDSCQ